MKIAIPVTNGLLDAHFGHCKVFALLDVDQATKQITNRNDVDAPPHEPGVLPRWLAEQNVNLIISGGMGHKAQQLFTQNSIDVIVGAPAEAPESLAAMFLDGSLTSGTNACDH